MAYEISQALHYQQAQVETPLGQAAVQQMVDWPVLVTVLRAGVPFFDGFLDFFDQSNSAFIGAARKEGGQDEISIALDYVATPNLTGKTLIIADPMLATGQSILQTLEALKPYGTPAFIHIAAVVAAPEGVNFLAEKVPEQTRLWVAALDEKLNSSAYIVPGLGDAGDLAFGPKTENI